MRTIGLIVNPIAGMGGSVGLKGTDNGIYKKAIKLGAQPVTPQRIKKFFSYIEKKTDVMFYVAPEEMGEDYIKNFPLEYEVIGTIEGETSPKDTKRIAKTMLDKKIELLIFCGGDGTARDIYDAIQLEIPVIGIPSGVKMFSSIFALNPRAAFNLFESFLEGAELQECEVLDIDEEAFRNDRLDSKLYGYLKVPKRKTLIQGGKKSSGNKKSEAQNKTEIAEFVIQQMENNTLYFLGPGTTVKTISEVLKIDKSLLGVDAIYNKKLMEKDVNEQRILKLLEKYKSSKAKVCISPIGGQGFIFGRGNKQFTPNVLKQISRDDIIIVSTEDKLKELDCLRVDTGDTQVDERLKGYIKVIVGRNQKELMEVK